MGIKEMPMIRPMRTAHLAMVLVALVLSPLAWANGLTEQASTNSVASPLRILGQAGHGASVCAVTYNDDATLMATGDTAGAVIVWRTTDFLQTHRFFGTGKWASALAFSHDSRYLAVATPITLRVIDLVANKVVHEQPASDGNWIWHLSFGATRDELFAVMSPTAYSQQYQWNRDGFRDAAKFLKVIHPFTGQWSSSRALGSDVPKSLYVSPNHGWVSVGFSSGNVSRFQTKDLALLETQTVPGSADGVGETADGQWRAVCTAGLFALERGVPPKALSKTSLLSNDPDAFGPIQFSVAGNLVALPTEDRNVQVLDTRDGRLIRTSSDYTGSDVIAGTAAGLLPDQILVAQSGTMHLITPDGRKLVLNDAISPRGGLLPDAQTRKLIFSGDSPGDAWGDSGRLGTIDFAALRVTVAKTGTPKSTLSPISSNGISGYVLANSEVIRFGRDLQAWPGRPEQTFQHASPEVRVSPDGKTVYAFEKDKKSMTKYDLSSGRLTRNSRVLWNTKSDDVRFWLDGAGKTVLLNDGQDVVVLSTVTEKPLYVAQDVMGTGALAVSANGRFLFLPNMQNRALELFDLEQGRVTSSREASEETMYMFNSPTRAALSSRGDRVALANAKGLFVYSTSDWSLVREFPLSSNEGSGTFLFAWDDSVILHADDGGVLNVGNLVNGSLVHVRMTDDDWLFYTDDGYFEGSSNSGRMLAVLQGAEAYGMDQLATRFNRPDILMERLGTSKANPELYGFFRANYQKRLARMGLTEAQVAQMRPLPVAKLLSSTTKGDEATIDLAFDGVGEELARFSVYVNDVPLFGQGGRPIEGPQVTSQVSFALIPGENKVEVSCFNALGAESLRVLSRLAGPTARAVQPPRLFYLGFGVSKYANSDLNLRYAHKDALDLEAAFQKTSGGRYSQVLTKTFINEQVDLQTMSLAKSFLAQARPQDTVILFIAGHGVFTQGSETPDYFYLAHQTDVTDLEHTAIRFSEVEELLQGLPARQKLFLMDTCNSGEVDPLVGAQVASLGTATAARAVRGLAVKTVAPPASIPRSWLLEKGRYSQNDLIRRSGAIVFSSSKGGEYSYESDEIGNGMFTSAILQVLDGRLSSQTNPDGTVGVRALVAAVAAEVPHMTSEMQHPGVDRDNLSVNFTLPVIDPADPRRELTLRLSGLPRGSGPSVALTLGRTDAGYDESQTTLLDLPVNPQGSAEIRTTWLPAKGLTVEVPAPEGVHRYVVDPPDDADPALSSDVLVVDASHHWATLKLNGRTVVPPAYGVTLTVRGLADVAGQTVWVVGGQGQDNPSETPEIAVNEDGTVSTEFRLSVEQESLVVKSNFADWGTLPLTNAVRRLLDLDKDNTMEWDLREATPLLTINGRKVP